MNEPVIIYIIIIICIWILLYIQNIKYRIGEILDNFIIYYY